MVGSLDPLQFEDATPGGNRWPAMVVLVLVCLLTANGSMTGPIHGDGESCTSFVLSNRGQVILATNYDRSIDDDGVVFIQKRGFQKTGFNPSTTGVVGEWTSRYASVVFSLVGNQHAWAGMNDAGLTLSTMALRESVGPAADHRPSLDMMWPQYLLDTCERVDDVIATNVTVRPSTLDHHLVADRFGGVAVIEILDGQMVATTGEDLCAAALTNSVYSYSCDMWELMRDHGNYPDDDNSILRFCRAADLVAAFSGASQGRAIAFALDSLREIYPPLLRGYTRWSIVFDTENLRAYFRTQRNRETRWVDLEAFDLRCGQPIMMLDINAQLSGDVSDAFVPYDSARNREVMLDYYRRWNISYDPISVDWLLDHIESFPCCETRRPSARRTAPSAELRRRIEDRAVIP